LSSETSDSITPSESPSITASSSPEEPITTEAIKEAATLQAAPAPEASEETMSDSDAMTEALKSETEPETLTGELSAVRTPENPTESTTGEDVLPDGGVEAAADGSTGSSPPVAQQEAAQVGGKDAKMRAEIGSTLASTVQAVEKDEAKVDAVAQKAEDAQAEAIENTEKKP